MVGIGTLVALAVDRIGFIDPMTILGQEQSDVADHADEAAGRVCASAEPNDKDLVVTSVRIRVVVG